MLNIMFDELPLVKHQLKKSSMGQGQLQKYRLSTLRYAAVHQDGVSKSTFHVPSLIECNLQVSKVFSKSIRLDHRHISPIIRLHHVRVGTCRHFG